MPRPVHKLLLPSLPCALLALAAIALADADVPSQGASAGQAGGETIERGRLDNGLRVFFVPDRRTPSVVVQLWYPVGSADEPPGLTGISHILEHMMFWDDKKRPKELYKRRIESLGGKYNAFTSYNFTAYYANVASVHLEEVLELEAERMRGLRFGAEQFEKERQVVLEERHLRVTNQPESELREQMLIAAYERNGLRNPIIGWADDISSVEIDDLHAWRRLWYQPGRAALIVVGDTDFERLMELAEDHFGRIRTSAKDKQLDPPPRLSEPAPKALKQVTYHTTKPAQLVKMLWKVPSLDRDSFDAERIKDSVSLDVLASFIGDGKSGWLHRRLVRGEEIALSISARVNNTLRDSGMFWINARPRKGVSHQRLAEAILEELRKIDADSIRDEDLARAQTELIASSTYLRDSPFYQAYVLGLLEFSGAGWEMLEGFDKMVAEVKAEDLLSALSTYLLGQAHTSGWLVSTPEEPAGGELGLAPAQ